MVYFLGLLWEVLSFYVRLCMLRFDRSETTDGRVRERRLWRRFVWLSRVQLHVVLIGNKEYFLFFILNQDLTRKIVLDVLLRLSEGK